MKQKIRFVLYADPPARIFPSITDLDWKKPCIVYPSCWSKDALKLALKAKITNTVENGDRVGNIIASSMNSRGGLLLVAETPLKEIVSQNWYRKNSLDLESASLCCCLKHDVEKGRRTYYLINAYPFQFITQKEGGCNPKSYNYFPNAPKFNKMIIKAIHNRCKWDWDKKRLEEFNRRPLITDNLIKYHFPQIKFDNQVLDSIVSFVHLD